MSKNDIDVRELLRISKQHDNVETQFAFFNTRLPWIGPAAFLHIVFRPAPPDALQAAQSCLNLPRVVRDFLATQNGAVLFAGALSIYGVHRSGQLLNRDGLPEVPFNIEEENLNWPPCNRHQFLAIGGYSFDGSTVCIDRHDSQLYLFKREHQRMSRIASQSWRTLGQWLRLEIDRLSALFDEDGRRLVDESLTVPMTPS